VFENIWDSVLGTFRRVVCVVCGVGVMTIAEDEVGVMMDPDNEDTTDIVETMTGCCS
jgi:hypothetical protein